MMMMMMMILDTAQVTVIHLLILTWLNNKHATVKVDLVYIM